jgi:hypothetical protein
MPLFTDGPPSSLEDLTDQDSGLLDVCRLEQIDASRKSKLAHAELGSQLHSLIDEQRTIYLAYHNNPYLSLSHVVVTPNLKTWHTFQTLALIYRDAYFNQLNDRFQAKWTEYNELSATANSRLRETGVGIVLDPLQRPDAPVLAAIPAAETGGMFYFSVCLVNSTGEESQPSPVASIQVPDGYAVDLHLASIPSNATGWNVYGGASPETLYLQNQPPVDTSLDWIYGPSTALLNGRTPGFGQKSNFSYRLPRRLLRG